MATYEEVLAGFKKEMDNMGIGYHEDIYHAIAKHLGPAIYDDNASMVNCSDPTELATVKKNFLIKKLGLEDGPELDHMIEQVSGAFGNSNPDRNRATFYYLLTALAGKESLFIDKD